MSVLGIVAGNGILPGIVARQFKQKNNNTVILACHRGETDPELVRQVDAAQWFKAGHLGKIIRFFEAQKVSEVVFAGGLPRPNLLRGFWPDLTALAVIRRAGGLKDDALLREIAREFEKHGMRVLAPQTVLPELLTPAGFKVGTLSDQQISDGIFGWRAAEALGELDVGQTAIAHRSMIIALEGIEGTDRCILRAGELCGPGFTVVKRAKPQQDHRFDLPTIGEKTIETLVTAKAGALIIHANGSLLLNPMGIEKLASAAKLNVLAIGGLADLQNGATV